MIYVIALAAAAVVCLLVWLIATYKVNFPLLFDCGLAVITLGVIVWADGAITKSETLNAGGAAVLAGLLLLFASFIRERKKQRKELRRGNPRELDGRHIQNITGGKQ